MLIDIAASLALIAIGVVTGPRLIGYFKYCTGQYSPVRLVYRNLTHNYNSFEDRLDDLESRIFDLEYDQKIRDKEKATDTGPTS